MKIFTHGIGVLLFLSIFAPYSHSAHNIMRWPDNKKGAVSLTFDDGCKSQLTLGLSALEERGYRGTFFLVTDSVKCWDGWRMAAESGHEIGSHTKTHPHLTRLPIARMKEEMMGSKTEINARIASQELNFFAYPYGELDPSVESIARDLFVASRGGGIACGLNGDSVDFSNVKGCSPDDGNDIFDLTDAAERQGKWLVAIFHSVEGGKDCYGSWAFPTWAAYLDHLGNKDLWVNTFGAAVKYIRERESASVSVHSRSDDQITLRLTDPLDDATYDEPLTIRSTLPPDWGTVIVRQGSDIAMEESVLEGEERVIYYHAVPDRGLVSLRKIHAE